MRFITKAQEAREQQNRDELFLKKLHAMGWIVNERQRDEWKDEADESGAVRDRGREIGLIAGDIEAADECIGF